MGPILPCAVNEQDTQSEMPKSPYSHRRDLWCAGKGEPRHPIGLQTGSVAGNSQEAMMTVKRIVFSIVLAAMPVVSFGQAPAKVPAHAPGTICFTPHFWCWAQPSGPPGTVCGCPSSQGWVRGVRG
jgi:hypothetical protein